MVVLNLKDTAIFALARNWSKSKSREQSFRPRNFVGPVGRFPSSTINLSLAGTFTALGVVMAQFVSFPFLGISKSLDVAANLSPVASRRVSTKLALTAFFVALGFTLSLVSFPVGPTRIFPFQHTINVLVGVMLGPLFAAIVAFGIGTLRVVAGTGTLFAYPGGIPGGIVVGALYWYILRRDECALSEPLGTALGGIISAVALAPLIGARPLPSIFGMAAQWQLFVVFFLLSSIPGSIIGYVVVKSLRRIGVFERIPV